MNIVKGLYVKLFFLCIVLAFSCKKQQNSKSKEIFKTELNLLIDSLNKNNIGLYKYIEKDGKKDTLYLKKPNWKKEWAVVFNSLLSKRQAVHYQINKIKLGHDTQLEYLDLSNQLKIKKVLTRKSKNKLNYGIKFSLKNRLAFIDYNIEINSKKGYLIESTQKVPYTYQTKYRIEGIFK